MRPAAFLAATLVACTSLVSAKRVIITVGANKTADPSQVFSPQSVQANIGDTVTFNFTNGSYSATQADFASPCIFITKVNTTIPGFDTGTQATNNGTAPHTYDVPITDNSTKWYFDFNGCSKGVVGVINVNDSTGQTLAGFTRNAIRLNGTASSSSARPSATGGSNSSNGAGTSTTSSSSGGSSSSDGSVARNAILGTAAALPLAVIALML
ncbi:hypothetical protein BDY19DRAFT_907086 [Irpex rosettiformis]|uniref:Uncharacterized protein n=1 Tax=Irpex rosettiformis TaxID=378272 RepID=A0ACB8U1L3_9APHY|nr:hypothetical protein BDY19DRAFT_907086 [Irpex rosettiformis]